MASPVVSSRTTTTTGTTSQGQFTPSIGAASVGDLLLVVVVVNSSSNVAISAGTDWHRGALSLGSITRTRVFWKVATGSDALSLECLDLGIWRSIAYVITGHGSAVSIGGAASGSSTNPDPGNVAQSGAAQDALAIAIAQSALPSAAPASYSNLTTVGSSGLFLATAERALTAITSENPGAFTAVLSAWAAGTVLVASTAITAAARASQVAAETISQVNPNARVTQVAVESISHVDPRARVSQVVVEMISTNVPDGVGNANKYRQLIINA